MSIMSLLYWCVDALVETPRIFLWYVPLKDGAPWTLATRLWLRIDAGAKASAVSR